MTTGRSPSRCDGCWRGDEELELSKTEFDLLELLAFNAGEVIELATDRRGDEPVTRVAMAPLLERVAARSSQRAGRPVQVRSDDTVVMGRELALERSAT